MTNHDNRQGELLAAYHDALVENRAATPDSDLDPSLAGLARQMQHDAHRNAPSAAFAAQLEQRIVDKLSTSQAGAAMHAVRDTAEKELTMRIPSTMEPGPKRAHKPATLFRVAPRLAGVAVMLGFILGATYIVSMLAARSGAPGQGSGFGSNQTLSVPDQQPGVEPATQDLSLSEILSRIAEAARNPLVTSFHITWLDRFTKVAPPSKSGGLPESPVVATTTLSTWFQSPNLWHVRYAPGDGNGSGNGRLVETMSGFDGINQWKYDVASNQAFSTPVLGAKMPADFAADVLQMHGLPGDVENCYDVTLGSDTVSGRATYLLELGVNRCGESGAEKLAEDRMHKVWLDKETFLVLRHDYLDTEGELIQSVEAVSVEYNLPVDSTIFSLPPGAEIVEPVEKPEVPGKVPAEETQGANKQP